MKHIRYFLFALVFIAVSSLSAIAGNKWMMEKGGKELIMLNAKLMEKLASNVKDGQISLSGDVVHRDGKVVIRLYQLQQTGMGADGAPLPAESFDNNVPYHIFLREEELSEIPVSDEVKKN